MSGTILLKTERMRGVTIDPERRIARAEAGTIWIEVVEAAAEHGLAALAGSSPDVGVVGYTLGGGLSWLARKHGIGANQVTAIEVVTASGDLVRTDWANDPTSSGRCAAAARFGIVTAIEFNLFPITEVYAGILWFPVDRAGEILKAWRAWTDGLPDEMTSVGRILQFPPIPAIPEPVRGQSYVVVEIIWSGTSAEGATLVEPLRLLGPVMDTVMTLPIQELAGCTWIPRTRTRRGRRRHARRRRRPPDRPLRRAYVRLADPLGRAPAPGRCRRPARLRHGAIDAWEAPYAMFAVGVAPTPEARRAVEASVAGLRDMLEPWEADHVPQLRRVAAQDDLALLERELPPPPPDQGNRRPDGSGPLEPPCCTRKLSIRSRDAQRVDP